MNSQQSYIINRFLDGSITIDSTREFEKLLDIFPRNPAFHKAFADLLVREKSFDAAVEEYGEAARLFIDAGMTLQAIASKVSEWQIARPPYLEAIPFLSALREGITGDIPVHKFFTKMAYPEIVAVMNGLVRVHLPAGKRVKKLYDPEDDINFIVSGALNERMYHISEGEGVRRISSEDMAENDFWGDIYPFEEEKVSRSDIDTITRVELMKISKHELMKICAEYPNVKLLLEDMYKAQSDLKKEGSSHIVRKTVRYEVLAKIKIKSIIDDKDAGKSPFVVEGITQDISLGGSCILLGARYQTGPFAGMVGRTVNIQISVPEEDDPLSILGKIVWSKEVSHKGKTAVIVGVEFKDMTVLGRERLKRYCYGSNGAESLIFNLWDSLMKV